MKTMSIWVASATLFLASMGICSCSMGSTTSSEMRGSLEFTQDDLREKPFKAIDVDMVASVYYTQNDGDECSVRLDTLPSRMLSSFRNSRRKSRWCIETAK